ncbi:MAG: hypothetical protein R3E32_00745 [Chitinophagales bacterium]
MQFKDVIGQQSIKNYLLNSAQSDQVSHAQLFLGNEGSGNLALAIAYAQYLQCRNRGEQDACGTCRSCVKANKLMHPDIHFSYPTVGSKAKSTDFLTEWRTAVQEHPYMNVYQWLQDIKAENKQGNITREECEAIIRKLSLRAYESTYKVLIMWMPEYLGKEGNRLLKLIEEPPANTVFLLVAENANLILNTILSRTQQLRVYRLSDAEISEALVNRHGVTANAARQVAILAEGDYNKALELLSNSDNDNQQLLIKWLGACLSNQSGILLEWVEEIAKLGRENQKNFIKYALYFLRQSLLLQMEHSKTISLDNEELQFARQLMEKMTLENFEAIIQLLDNASYHIERNANPKILFLHVSIQVMDSYRVLMNESIQ